MLLFYYYTDLCEAYGMIIGLIMIYCKFILFLISIMVYVCIYHIGD